MILIDARCVFLEQGEKQVDFCTGKSMDDIVFTRGLVGPNTNKGNQSDRVEERDRYTQ